MELNDITDENYVGKISGDRQYYDSITILLTLFFSFCAMLVIYPNIIYLATRHGTVGVQVVAYFIDHHGEIMVLLDGDQY